MSWIKRRPYLALGLLAFLLRASCSVVTEFKPIFPTYYYTDANMIDAAAVRALADVRRGEAPLINGTLSERLQTAITMEVYRAFGRRPLAIKCLNAAMGALGVVAFAWALGALFSPQASLLAGGLVALWPSHIFYTSQNLKEAPADLLAYAALGAALHAGFDLGLPRRRASTLALGAAVALLGAGLYRSYVLLCLTAALLLALVLASWEKSGRARALTVAAALAAVLPVYPFAAHAVEFSFHSSIRGSLDELRISSRLIPITLDNADPSIVNRPTSPRGITGFRKARQWADRTWARMHADREIGTQIYPDADFKTWGDLILYIPKGAFTVLFMPLPGLYPLAGKIGRWAAAGENILLLALASLALLGFVRGPKTPGRLALLAFFAAMTVGAALLEFDLGSAGRHKLLYLPMLFPFAAEEALRLLGYKESA